MSTVRRRVRRLLAKARYGREYCFRAYIAFYQLLTAHEVNRALRQLGLDREAVAPHRHDAGVSLHHCDGLC